MNLIGKMLDNRYEILEKIGNGGMATVYKAKDHVLNRFDAIKILKDEFTTDTEFIKKFNSEAQSAASLSHPNIVSIYDVGSEDNLYYIVMELIQGKTLKEIIIEDGILSWKWSVNIAIQIASALEVAHKNNIIHRDIKPHNIIITEDGIAKVTDFGIAKAVSNSTITAFGTTIGSVHYFSPEHAKGGYTDAKSDLYSLGIVLYEMLTARVPFDADTPVSVALKQVQEEPVEPIEYNSEIPKSVNMIILKAMQKDPNYRYQNATEMLEDLQYALKNPDADFVVINKVSENSPTQKIPTIYDIDLERNGDRKAKKLDEDEETKPKGKIGKFFAKHKVLKVILIIIVAIGLFFGAMFGTLSFFARPEQVQIPNLVKDAEGKSLTKEQAIALLEDAGLSNYNIELKNSDDVEKGHIISQDPEYQENFMVNKTQEIKLVVSEGKLNVALEEKLKNAKIKLPKKMVGKKKDDLIKELQELLEELEDEELHDVEFWEIKEEFNEEVEAGIVTDVDQKAGEEITLDTKMVITVSKGSQYKDITVPSVVNKSEEEARNTLQSLGLAVEVTYEENTNKSNGIVTSQSVNANKVVKEGTSISLVVNKLPTKTTVTVNVNLKSLMNYTEPTATTTTTTTTSNDTNTTNTTTTTPEIKSSKVVIKVGEDTIYSDTNKLTTTNISATYSATGVKDVKVYVDDVVKFNKSIDFAAGDQTVTVE